LVERRLAEVSGRLRALREELRVIDEQLVHLGDDADDARLRALVSETPLADREHREARRHADAMARRRAEVVESIAALEIRSDELLDRLLAG
jgi:hypothetical protein